MLNGGLPSFASYIKLALSSIRDSSWLRDLASLKNIFSPSVVVFPETVLRLDCEKKAKMLQKNADCLPEIYQTT